MCSYVAPCWVSGKLTPTPIATRLTNSLPSRNTPRAARPPAWPTGMMPPSVATASTRDTAPRLSSPLASASWQGLFNLEWVFSDWVTPSLYLHPPEKYNTHPPPTDLLTFSGFLVDLISHSVISGFTTGAALTIVVEQIKVT